MTYCLGILLPTGLVLASDSRTSAGVDQIAQVKKLAIFSAPDNRVIAVLSAGNLATTQAVVTTLRQSVGSGAAGDLFAAATLFDAARVVGDTLRDVVARDGTFVQPHGDPNASFLVGGQIAGESHRLFQVYSAGNFVEATARARFLQIGETKYGKPILDRALTSQTTIEEAAKLTLMSFDATLRSNLSVGMPIDLLRYKADSFSAANLMTFRSEDGFWGEFRSRASEGLAQVLRGLPVPPDAAG